MRMLESTLGAPTVSVWSRGHVRILSMQGLSPMAPALETLDVFVVIRTYTRAHMLPRTFRGRSPL